MKNICGYGIIREGARMFVQWRYDGLHSGPKPVAKQYKIVKQRDCVLIVHQPGWFT